MRASAFCNGIGDTFIKPSKGLSISNWSAEKIKAPPIEAAQRMEGDHDQQVARCIIAEARRKISVEL